MADQHIGYPGSVSSAQLASWLPNTGAAQYSVESANDAKVVVNGIGSRGVTVKKGTIIGDGIMDVFDSDTNLNFGSVSSGSPDRWDMIVLRRTWNATPGASTSIYTIIPGNANRSMPARNNNKGVLADQPIALCRIKADNTTVQEIVDLRCWAHNGGVFAVDALVKNYIDQAGTHLTIGNDSWIRKISTTTSTDSPTWVQVSSSTSTRLGGVGGALNGNPAGINMFQIQAGTDVISTDASGYARVTWPNAFPKGLLSVVAVNADEWALPGTTIAGAGGVNGGVFGSSGYGNKTSWVYTLMDENGNKVKNKSHRINWIAIGW